MGSEEKHSSFFSTENKDIGTYNEAYSKVGETMAKRFVARKRKPIKRLFHLIILAGIIYFVAQLCFTYLLDIRLTSSNEEFLKALLNDSNHHLLYEKGSKNLFSHVYQSLNEMNLKAPVSMLEKVFGFKTSAKVSNDADNPQPNQNTDYFEDPHPISVDKPKVYLYNTHQLENYSANNYEAYNITPNVLMASYIMKERLNDLGIPTIVEEQNVTDFLNAHGWDYSKSYQATRYFLEDAIAKNPSLDVFIDLHRDAIGKSASTATINGKSYAKVLFVVGTQYKGYEPTLNFANLINNKVKEKYPELTRGVLTKSGAGVNGVYNQDLKEKMLLIECGGTENTIEEVMNTVTALAEVLKDYMG